MITREVTLRLSEGVHARPAAKLVQVANLYDCAISLKVGSSTIDAKSVLSIMKLAIRPGTVVIIQAEGREEQIAAEAIVELLSGATVY